MVDDPEDEDYKNVPRRGVRKRITTKRQKALLVLFVTITFFLFLAIVIKQHHENAMANIDNCKNMVNLHLSGFIKTETWPTSDCCWTFRVYAVRPQAHSAQRLQKTLCK